VQGALRVVLVAVATAGVVGFLSLCPPFAIAGAEDRRRQGDEPEVYARQMLCEGSGRCAQ
jgi:hypothetical protein